MKRKCMLFFALFILTGCLSVSAAHFPIEENFDEYSLYSDLTNWERTSLCDLVEDEKGGKILKVGLNANTNNTLTRFCLDEAVTEGVYKLSYSMKPGADLSTIVWIGDSTRRSSYPVTYFSPDGSLVSGRASLTLASYTLLSNNNIDEWYDVEAIINLDAHTIATTITLPNGEKIYAPEYTFTEMGNSDLEDLKYIIFQVWQNKDSASYFDNIKLEKVPFLVEAKTGKIGNVFDGEELCKYNIEINNLTDKAASVSLEWQILSDEQIISRGNKEVKIDKNADKKVIIDTKASLYGCYKLKLLAKCINEDGSVYEIEKNSDFSKVLLGDEDCKKNEFFQFSTHLQRYGWKDSMELIARSGNGGIRDEVSWQSVEYEYGKYAIPSGITATLNYADEHGMEVLQILGYGNPIRIIREGQAYNQLVAPKTDEEIAAFAEYAAYVVKNSSAEYFEVWNEWNGGFNAEQLGAKEYVKLLKATYEAVKSVRNDVKVVAMATSGADQNFIRNAIWAGAYNYCDVISFHPYDKTGKTFPNTEWIEKTKSIEETVDNYLKVSNLFGNTQNKKMEYWLTEIGWTSADNDAGDWVKITEEEQAQMPVKLVTISKAYDLVDKIYWYDFQEDGMDERYSQDNFGVVNYYKSADVPLTAKPAFSAIAAMNKFMAEGITFDTSIEETDRSKAAYCFDRAESGKIAVMWTENTSDSMSLNLGCESISIYDLYGNKIQTMHSDIGVYGIKLTENPIYVEGDFTSFSLYTPEETERIEVSVESFKYNPETNFIEINGTASGTDEITIELLKSGEIITSIKAMVNDGKWHQMFNAQVEGECVIYVGRNEINSYGGADWEEVPIIIEPLNTEDDVRLISGVGIVKNSANETLTITGCLSNSEDGDVVSLIIVPMGTEPQNIDIDNICYIGEGLIQDESFSCNINLPEAFEGKSFDIYFGGTDVLSVYNTSVNYFKIASFTLTNDEKLTASAVLTNTLGDMNAVMVITQYDDEGRVVKVDTKDVVLKENYNSLTEEIFTAGKHSDAVKYSAFIWDSLTGMKPLFKNAEL